MIRTRMVARSYRGIKCALKKCRNIFKGEGGKRKDLQEIVGEWRVISEYSSLKVRVL